MGKSDKYFVLVIVFISVTGIVLGFKTGQIANKAQNNEEKIEDIKNDLKTLKEGSEEENVVMNFPKDSKRLHKIGSIEYNTIPDLLKIWNPDEGTAVWDVKISVDNGPVSLYSPKVPSRLKKVGDNFVKVKGDLIGAESKIFESGLYENYPYYTSLVFEISNADKVVVDDLSFGTPINEDVIEWDDMDKVVINITE